MVLKPTILWVGVPRTWLRAALGLALVQNDRASNSSNHGFQVQFLGLTCPQTWPSTRNLPTLKLDLSFYSKTNTLPLTDVQNANGIVKQIQKIRKDIRATKENPKHDKLRVLSRSC